MRILIVGLARNRGRKAIREVKRLYAIFGYFGHVEFFVVESDSSDGTVEEFSSFSSENGWFSFVSLGDLRDTLPRRTVRLAHCRNKYLEEINLRNLATNDLVVAADLDLKFNLLSQEAIDRSLRLNGWDILTSNQQGPYYDIWALRHPELSPNDYRVSSKFYQDLGMRKLQATIRTLYARMVSIPSDCPRIPVQSAFGGLALYRPWVFRRSRYSGIDSVGREISEHVPFNLNLVAQGAQVLIEPGLITTKKTNHSSAVAVTRSIVRGLRSRPKAKGSL